MRFKAIPGEAVAAVKSHPLALALVVAGVGGFYLYHSGHLGAVAASSTDAGVPGTMLPSYGSGLSGGTFGGVTAGDGTTAGDGGASAIALAALALQSQKQGFDYNLGLANIQAQSDAIAAQTTVSFAALAAERLSIVGGIAQSFLSMPWKQGGATDGFKEVNGSIVDSFGQSISFGFNAFDINPAGRAVEKSVATIQTLTASQATMFASIPNGGNNVSQSGTTAQAGIGASGAILTNPADVPNSIGTSQSSGYVASRSGSTLPSWKQFGTQDVPELA